jgi:hypothetical protein
VGALGAFLEQGEESDYPAPLGEHCLRSLELVNCVEAYLIAVKCAINKEKVYYFIVFLSVHPGRVARHVNHNVVC